MKFRDYIKEASGVEKLFKNDYKKLSKIMEKNGWVIAKKERVKGKFASAGWVTWINNKQASPGDTAGLGNKAVLQMDDWLNKPEGTYLIIFAYDFRGMGNKSVADEIAHNLKKGGFTANSTTHKRQPVVLVMVGF
jgi:hypothetical protein